MSIFLNHPVEELSSEEEVVIDVKDYRKEVERRNQQFLIRPKTPRPLSPLGKEDEFDADREECYKNRRRHDQKRLMYWYKKNRYNEFKERNMGKFMLKALESMAPDFLQSGNVIASKKSLQRINLKWNFHALFREREIFVLKGMCRLTYW